MWSQNIGLTHKMKISDSIYKKVEMFYIAERGAVNSHINVYKLIADKDVVLNRESMHLV
jgi:hypothetical protein